MVDQRLKQIHPRIPDPKAFGMITRVLPGLASQRAKPTGRQLSKAIGSGMAAWLGSRSLIHSQGIGDILGGASLIFSAD